MTLFCSDGCLPGCQQWALSWDLNDWSDEKPFKLIGQIGEHDEADFIPVLIKSESKARDVRGQLGDRIVVNANVRGLLCHETHLKTLDKFDDNDAEFLETIKEMTSAQYYVVLFDGDKSHKVEVLAEPVDFESGKIYPRRAPREWVPSDPYDTRLPGAYFLWEHTNVAQPDVIKYGVDSLQRKVHYLNERLQQQLGLSGELVLLQHLMPEGTLSGDMGSSIKPAIPTEQFRNLFLS